MITRRLVIPGFLGAAPAAGLLASAVLVAAAVPASADTRLGVSPALLEPEGHAGDIGRIAITITNGGDEAFEVRTGLEMFQGMVGERSALPWSAVTPGHLRLEPGQQTVAELMIRIPQDAASGGVYEAVSIATVPDANVATAALAGRIVVPVFLTVRGKGELERRPALERAALFLEPDGRLGARVQVRGDGNVHVPLAGTVELRSPALATPARLGIPTGRVLPGAARTYAGDATLPLPMDTTYQVTVQMGPADNRDQMVEPTLTTAFDLAPTASLGIGRLAICENLDRGPTASATVGNEGTLGLLPTAEFAVQDASGVVVGTTPADLPALAWPGDAFDTRADLAERLPVGEYTLVLAATYGADQVAEARLPFSIGGDPAAAAPLCDGTAATAG